jgi:hypothetical protein
MTMPIVSCQANKPAREDASRGMLVITHASGKIDEYTQGGHPVPRLIDRRVSLLHISNHSNQ